jgi:hypothetical protein
LEEVAVDEQAVERRLVAALVIRVSNIVDTELSPPSASLSSTVPFYHIVTYPDREERVRARPAPLRLAVPQREVADLVCERAAAARRHDAPIDRRAANGEVVCQDR